MTIFVSPRKIRLLSPDSSTLTLEANVPTDIPAKFVQYAIMHDCMPAEAPKVEPVQSEFVPLSVEDALTAIVEKGDPGDFSAGGLPRPVAVKALIGRAISAREIVQVWEAMNAPKAD